MHELEAKFLTSTGQAPQRVQRRLQQSLAWAGFRIEPEGRRTFTDTYLDTPDQQLRRAGWSYRQREDAGGRRIALQEINGARDGIFDREAVEQALPRDTADFGHPGPGPVQERLSNLLHPEARLAPLFRVHTRRAAYRLSHPDHPRGLVEMAFDSACIDTPQAVEFDELELAMKTGPHELLAGILAAVELEPGLLEARLSRFQRGLMAAGCSLERVRPLKSGAVRPDFRWLDLALMHLTTQLKLIVLYEPYAWESVHPEGVHLMRVATRRARAALHSFAKVLPPRQTYRLECRLRDLTALLGEVRDLDVQTLRLAAYREHLDDLGLDLLANYRTHLDGRRQAAHGRLIEVLAGAEYQNLLNDYRMLLDTAVREEPSAPLRIQEVADASISKRLERLCRRGRATSRNAKAKHLHQLRIHGKHLRYQLEFLQPAYPGRFDDAVTALRKLQNRLGNHQDACVAREQLASYRKQYAASKAERQTLKKLMGLEAQRARRQRRKFAGTWERFERAAGELAAHL